MTTGFDVAAARAQFTALDIREADDNGLELTRVYFDNPAGTQVPKQVVYRTIDTLLTKNANLGGYFRTTQEATALVEHAHEVMADFYGAASPDEIIFGQNMTTLTLHFSRCLAKRFKKGDEIILSRMDHDANVGPWLQMAEDVGMKVKWMEFDPDTYEFADTALTKVLSKKTKLVCFGYASNCTGTINDVKRFSVEAKAAGALVYVDAVQFAPHGLIDVQDLGCDFLVSSAYKWFGPHMAVLWGKRTELEKTPAYKVRAVGDTLPDKFETGTQSHEGMAGCIGAIEYLESLGSGATRREKLTTAWNAMRRYEEGLSLAMIKGLQGVKGVTVRGVTSANAMHRRVPTVSFTVEGHHPKDLAVHFARDNIYVWSGHNYALEPINHMGLMDKGGVLRVGLAHYNTHEEVARFVDSLKKVVG
jgi:cysteine desulfurase family protein (TIGR01976 family)